MQYGAIDVYEVDDANALTWVDEITSVVPEHDAKFGETMVALDDMLIVNAWTADVDGKQDAGQVFCYRRTDDGWVGESVVEDGGCNGRYLGISMAASESTILVTERDCLDGNQNAVRVYTRDGTDWIHETTIVPLECTESGCPLSAGSGLAVGSDYLVIGNAFPHPPFGPDSGVVYIYERLGGSGPWELVQELTPSFADPGAGFGYRTVLLDDDTMLIVASYGFSTAPARVYMFARGGDGRWSETNVITIEQDGTGTELFGYRVALSPDKRSALFVAPGSNLVMRPLSGAVYHIDLGTGEQRILRPVNAWSDRTVLAAAFLTNDTILIGESNASPFGLQYAGQIFRVDLNTYVNCHQDLTRDGTVGVEDLVQMLSEWGSGMPSSDLDCSGAVDFMDVLLLLSVWGECAMPPGI